ncbi:hypothetical protein [Dongia deserti]|uniref:hypothetical protein n=1 Tax=Dongia deserti TaxID=2268030 RepID=UPI0025484A37|nr:hypothetical protein [Dongia deserti]
MDEPIPADLRDFILRYIDSVAHLEALLLLRANPQTSWDVPAVAARLYTSEAQAGEVLAQLCGEGLIASENDLYRYAGQSAETLAMIDRLAEFYSKQLIPITNLIHGKPRRIRQFADAFKFRKDN